MATTTYDYFNYGGLQQINHTHSGHTVGTTPPPATQLNSYDYTYDDNGRINSIESNDGTRLYQYDNTGQLIRVTDGAASLESYDYDATGNRTAQTVNGASNTTVVTRNRLMSDGTYSYIYDDEGNTTQKVTIATGDYQTYTWDHRNRLIQVEFKDSTDTLQKTVRYTYDAFARRVLTEVDANADGVFEDFQRSVWDGSHVSLVLDETSTVEHRFLHGPMVDMVLADESATDGLLWYLTDHQNTVRDVIDNTGTVLNHIDYTSFGEILTETDDTYTPYFAYTGRELDQHTGLQYNRARWYDPGTGRWLSEDPIRWAAGDVNLQRYVTNSPLNATDPSGRIEEPTFGETLIPFYGSGKSVLYHLQEGNSLSFVISVAFLASDFFMLKGAALGVNAAMKISWKAGLPGIGTVYHAGRGLLHVWWSTRYGMYHAWEGKTGEMLVREMSEEIIRFYRPGHFPVPLMKYVPMLIPGAASLTGQRAFLCYTATFSALSRTWLHIPGTIVRALGNTAVNSVVGPKGPRVKPSTNRAAGPPIVELIPDPLPKQDIHPLIPPDARNLSAQPPQGNTIVTELLEQGHVLRIFHVGGKPAFQQGLRPDGSIAWEGPAGGVIPPLPWTNESP